MNRPKLLAVAVVLSLCAPAAVTAGVPEATPGTPVLEAETRRGSIVRTFDSLQPGPAKVVDGNAADWAGASTRLGGTSIYSRGELVYQDYVNDAWGADDGYDAERLRTLHEAKAAEPRTYRVDALQQAAGAQFGAARPVGASLRYGDAAVGSGGDTLRTHADLAEVRLAADPQRLLLLTRTLTMLNPSSVLLLVLVDSEAGGRYALPRAAGSVMSGAEWALVVSPVNGVTKAFFKGAPVSLPGAAAQVAYDASSFANTIELSVDRSYLSLPAPSISVGVAAGLTDDGTGFKRVVPDQSASDLVNVAFRSEPPRIWMDERQALALWRGEADEFLAPVSLARLEAGYTERYTMRPGYYEAVYHARVSDVNFEGSTNAYHQGLWQHYGVYLPARYSDGGVHPATFWMHYRGGHAHDAAAWEPGILREFGDEIDAIVVTPSARGESSWYTGRGLVDFLDVWDDAFERWSIDADRVYLAGHSMGGWASNFLGLVFPDRWAASNPQDGLLVPGLWPGVGSPTTPQNGADVNAEFLYPLLGNARNVPYAILHGTADELVPVTGAIMQGQRYHELGYRYRTYLFHAYEHYSAPIWDDWREVVRYMTQFRRNPNPPRVTYTIKPALDRAASTISVPTGVNLQMRFDRAYWVSDLRTRRGDVQPDNLGTIDATTYGRGVPDVIAVPEAGTGGQVEPYTMHGQAWVNNGVGRPENKLAATLTNLSHATLDTARMALSTSETMTATVTTDGSATVRLTGPWAAMPSVDGAAAALDGTALVLTFAAAGSHSVTITP